jgi:hypothetical protein
MNIILSEKIMTVALVQKNCDWLFLFGDNLIGKGEKGQAVIRDCENSMGIPTKKKPSMSSDSFFTDAELEKNKKQIDIAFVNIMKYIFDKKPTTIFIPKKIGCGLSALPIKAPQTFLYIISKINELIWNI